MQTSSAVTRPGGKNRYMEEPGDLVERILAFFGYLWALVYKKMSSLLPPLLPLASLEMTAFLFRAQPGRKCGYFRL